MSGWIRGLFGDVPADVVREIEARLTRVSLKRGATVFSSGDHADAMYAVVSGRMKLSRQGGEGPRRESLTSVITEGHVFGELSLLSPGPRTTTASALVATQLEQLAADDMRQLLDEHPVLARGLVKELADRLRHATDHATQLVLNDVRGRTASVLRRLARDLGRPGNPGTMVHHGLTQQELAHMVGASRESVNKVLMEFTESGTISISHHVVTILDDDALRTRAEHLVNPPSVD